MGNQILIFSTKIIEKKKTFMLKDENMRDLKQGKWENKGIYCTTNKMTRKSEY